MKYIVNRLETMSHEMKVINSNLPSPLLCRHVKQKTKLFQIKS
jgi:hypothetical protein